MVVKYLNKKCEQISNWEVRKKMIAKQKWMEFSIDHQHWSERPCKSPLVACTKWTPVSHVTSHVTLLQSDTYIYYQAQSRLCHITRHVITKSQQYEYTEIHNIYTLHCIALLLAMSLIQHQGWTYSTKTN